MSGDWFSERLLNWSVEHGRRDLPWQKRISPYRVWVSEIMLQQTRADAVIPYFERFIDRFPNIKSLAAAPLESVLAHWSGLGYYARARNLHRTAREIAKAGGFPDNLESLCALPGIGRSTAGAILSIAFEQTSPILDGNVKRVLARFYGVEGWPGHASINRELWALSEATTPRSRNREYSQAIMDLGATLCTPKQPRCGDCPLNSACFAYHNDRTQLLPSPRPRKKMRVKSCTMLILRNRNQSIYLEKRPPTGIWGGLWTFPEFESKADTVDWCTRSGATNLCWWSTQRHTFSHYHLDFRPAVADWTGQCDSLQDKDRGLWCTPGDTGHLGLPAPIKRILDRLQSVGQNGCTESQFRQQQE